MEKKALSIILVGLVASSIMSIFAPEVKAHGSWALTNAMNVAREAHTATLLNNGRILVSGGVGSAGHLSSVEMYDPSTEDWDSTGSMIYARDNHVAVLLTDGRVLVAGGVNSDGILSSAEVYNPSQGTWTITGSLTVRRYSPGAILLTSGKALVFGGWGGPGKPLSSAEIYNPDTGTWSPTGSMNYPRGSYWLSSEVVILPDGRVLVEGGYNGSSIVSSAEIYSPNTGTWSLTGSMNSARTMHTATLLNNGKVLVVGGYAAGTLVSCEIFDPSTGTWSYTGAMSTPRKAHTATLLVKAGVLVAGGTSDQEILASAEVYDELTGFWSSAGSMFYMRYLHTATLMQGNRVLVAGGFDGGSYIYSSVEIYTTSQPPPPPPTVVQANVDMNPNTLNLHSKGKWITGYVQLPEGYNPEYIDASTILINCTIQSVLDPQYEFVTNSSEYLVDHNNDGILERMVKFNRTQVAEYILSQGIMCGNVTLTISGSLVDEAQFEGSDIIRVRMPGDVNSDGKVDASDMFDLGKSYGSTSDNPKWNPNCDFSEDNKIEASDLLDLSRNYGKTYS